MRYGQVRRGGWLLLAVAIWVNPGSLAAQTAAPSATVPLDRLPDRVRQVMARPILFCHGPAEVFVGRPALYYWLLDHPDRAAQAWRRLGATCLGITERGPGRFGWTDSSGSDVSWETVHRDGGSRVWYAEGKVRPFLFLPSFPVRVVVILRHTDAPDLHRRSLIRQQADVYIHSDSKTAELVVKMLGTSTPRMAEQSISQMGLFFSGLAWYMDRHPEQIGMLDR